MGIRTARAGLRVRAGLLLRIAAVKAPAWQRVIAGPWGQRFPGLVRELFTEESLEQMAAVLRMLAQAAGG